MKKEELLKLGLSEEDATKVSEASATELKGFIPKGRFDELNETNKDLKKQVGDRDKQLENLKKVDAKGLQAEIDKLQGKNKADAETYDTKIKQLQVDNIVSQALGVSKAKNVKAARALLKLDDAVIDGETIKGLEDQIKALRKDETSKFLFEEEGEPSKARKGYKPGEGTSSKPGETTKEQFNRMSYKERVNLYNTDKTAYEELVGSEQ